MSQILIGIGWVIFTVLLYQLSKKIYKLFPTPFTIPMLVATGLMAFLFIMLDIPYQHYMESGGGWIAKLLGPGVVAFAIPLYKQRHVLQKYVVPIAGGVLVGTTVAIASDFAIASLMGTDKKLNFIFFTKISDNASCDECFRASWWCAVINSSLRCYCRYYWNDYRPAFIKMEPRYKLSW